MLEEIKLTEKEILSLNKESEAKFNHWLKKDTYKYDSDLTRDRCRLNIKTDVYQKFINEKRRLLERENNPLLKFLS